jgi:bifunctional oligoribonuclease and PAP phosphatase NrnA
VSADIESPEVTRERVLTRIREDSLFVLAAHESPDGDALGSLVGMQGLLSALGKDSRMFIAPDDLPLPPEYRFLKLDGLITEPPADIAQRTVVFLDCGNIDRNSASVLQKGKNLLNIDHHHDNTRFGTLDYVVPAASCTAEIVWDLMRGLDVSPTPEVARALYIGLITDTGRFMYENTTPLAHTMAGELIAAGVDVQDVYRRLYEDMPEAKLSLLARALGHMQRFDAGALTLAALSAEDFACTGAQDSFAEGVIDHLRAVQGTKLAALVRELGDGGGATNGPGGPAEEPDGEGCARTALVRRKVSLRATDEHLDVSKIARAQGGGGHRRAAGFTTTLELEALVEFLRRELAAQLQPAKALAPASA